MSTTDPIRDADKLQEFIQYYKKNGNIRNYCFVSLGLHTALRVSDLLNLKWQDVYNFENMKYKEHIFVIEKKTGKRNVIALNDNAINALELLKESDPNIKGDYYLFRSRKGENTPIKRGQAFKIIKAASDDLNIEGNISCHSLRKTFGYRAWKKGVQPAVLMKIFNHSSFEITKRYLCIDQDTTPMRFLKNFLTKFQKKC